MCVLSTTDIPAAPRLLPQVLFYRRFLHPRLDDNQRRVEREEERVWALRGQQRRALGLHRPHRPDKDAAWRLEQMYDDD